MRVELARVNSFRWQEPNTVGSYIAICHLAAASVLDPAPWLRIFFTQKLWRTTNELVPAA